MRKLVLLGLVAFGVLWGQSLAPAPEIKFMAAPGDTILRVTPDYHQWHLALDVVPYTAENPLKIDLRGAGYISLRRDGKEVLRIYSDETGTEVICRDCSGVQGFPDVHIGGAIHIGKSPPGDTKLVIRAGDELDDSPTTGDTWVTTKGDPSTSTNLELLEENK